MTTPNERRYFDALKRITLYDSLSRLRKNSEKHWGLEYHETLECAYENIQAEAAAAIRGRRRPKEVK